MSDSESDSSIDLSSSGDFGDDSDKESVVNNGSGTSEETADRTDAGGDDSDSGEEGYDEVASEVPDGAAVDIEDVSVGGDQSDNRLARLMKSTLPGKKKRKKKDKPIDEYDLSDGEPDRPGIPDTSADYGLSGSEYSKSRSKMSRSRSKSSRPSSTTRSHDIAMDYEEDDDMLQNLEALSHLVDLRDDTNTRHSIALMMSTMEKSIDDDDDPIEGAKRLLGYPLDTPLTIAALTNQFEANNMIVQRLLANGKRQGIVHSTGTPEQKSEFDKLMFIQSRMKNAYSMLKHLVHNRELEMNGIRMSDVVNTSIDIGLPVPIISNGPDNDDPEHKVKVEMLMSALELDLRRHGNMLYSEIKNNGSATCCYEPYMEIERFVWKELSPDTHPERFTLMNRAGTFIEMIKNVEICWIPELETDNSKVSYHNGIFDLEKLKFHPFADREVVIGTKSVRCFMDHEFDPSDLKRHVMDLARKTPALEHIMHTQHMFGDPASVNKDFTILTRVMQNLIRAERHRLPESEKYWGVPSVSTVSPTTDQGNSKKSKKEKKASKRKRGSRDDSDDSDVEEILSTDPVKRGMGPMEYAWGRILQIRKSSLEYQDFLDKACRNNSTGKNRDRSRIMFWESRDALDALHIEYRNRVTQIQCAFSGMVVHPLIYDVVDDDPQALARLADNTVTSGDWLHPEYDPQDDLSPHGCYRNKLVGDSGGQRSFSYAGIDPNADIIMGSGLECSFCKDIMQMESETDGKSAVDYDRMHRMKMDMPTKIRQNLAIRVQIVSSDEGAKRAEGMAGGGDVADIPEDLPDKSLVETSFDPFFGEAEGDSDDEGEPVVRKTIYYDNDMKTEKIVQLENVYTSLNGYTDAVRDAGVKAVAQAIEAIREENGKVTKDDIRNIMLEKKMARYRERRSFLGPKMIRQWWSAKENVFLKGVANSEYGKMKDNPRYKGKALSTIIRVAERLSISKARENQTGWALNEEEWDSDDEDGGGDLDDYEDEQELIHDWRTRNPVPFEELKEDLISFDETKMRQIQWDEVDTMLKKGSHVFVDYLESDSSTSMTRASAVVMNVDKGGLGAQWISGQEPWKGHHAIFCREREAMGRQTCGLLGSMNFFVKQHWKRHLSALLIGESGVGKSLLSEAMVANWFQDQHVGILESRPHAMWWLTNLYNKLIVITTELRRDSTINVSMLLKMIAGEKVVVQRRRMDEFEMFWKAPILFCGNEMGLRDTKGALLRRLAPVMFRWTPVTRDPSLEYELESESWATLIRCTIEYHILAGEALMVPRAMVASDLKGGKRPSDKLSSGARVIGWDRTRCQELRQGSQILAAQLDSMRKFVRNDMRKLKFGRSKKMLYSDFVDAYIHFCKIDGCPRRQFTSEDDVFKAYGLKCKSAPSDDGEGVDDGNEELYVFGVSTAASANDKPKE